MKLDYDCLRCTLLALEDLLKLEPYETVVGDRLRLNTIGIDQIESHKELAGYTFGEIVYSLYNLDQAGYIVGSIVFDGQNFFHGCSIHDITFTGHMFLKSVRDNKLWSKTKACLGKVGDASLAAVLEIAKTLALRAVIPS